MNIKLPKQWRQWCKMAGLRPYHGGRRHYDWFYLKGHGRVWRLNCYAMFECGDTYAEFDRWSLCDIQSVNMPTSEAQFLEAVPHLLYLKQK